VIDGGIDRLGVFGRKYPEIEEPALKNNIESE